MYICGDDNIPFIFLLLSILVYSIGYSTAYLVKFAPDSLIRLAKKSFGGILKGLSQGLSLFFIAINLYSIMIYLSAINGYLVDFNLPLFTLLLLLSIVWWSYLISCQVDKYAQKYIKITFLYNKNTFQKVFYLCKFFIKKFFR
jgi:hypothetical protein